MQIVCDSQAAFDLKECVLAFIYNMYIQACATHELICFDKKCIFFIFLSVMDLVSILRRRDDFKVKWIAQIVQFVLCIFFTIREERSAKATQ